MEALIRDYNENDKDNCMAAFKSNVPLFFAEEEIALFENFLNNLRTKRNDEANKKKTYFFVVAIEDKAIGCGGFGDKENKNIISLAWGLIHKDFHKMGFGKQLLLYRLQQIKKLYPAAPVVVDTTQFSYAFFEKFGFSTSKITNNFYAVGLHRYDMSLKTD